MEHKTLTDSCQLTIIPYTVLPQITLYIYYIFKYGVELIMHHVGYAVFTEMCDMAD